MRYHLLTNFLIERRNTCVVERVQAAPKRIIIDMLRQNIGAD